jgi:type IV pilus assembly protein PilM
MLFSHNALGLEISRNGSRMVAISGKPHMPRLEAFFDIHYPPGTLITSFKEKNVTNPDSFVSKIREAYLKLLVRTSRISVSLPDTVGRVTLLDLETRFKTKEEGTDIIRWKLKKNLPYEINDMHLDYQVLQEKKTGEMSVLVSLISRQVVTQYEDLLTEAGLQANRIDFTTFNLYRFFSSRLESIDNAAVISWHSGVLSILTFYNGVPDFYRAKEVPDGTGSAIRFFREINNSLMFYRDKNPGYSLNEVFYIVPPEDSVMMREVIAEAAGLTPILLDASRIITRNDGFTATAKELHALSASIGAAERNL